MADPLLIHHAATLGGRFPPSSLSGLAACLAAGAEMVEVDLVPLADGDFALLHDGRLDGQTDGSRLALVGRDAAGQWVQVCCVGGDQYGWVLAELVDLAVDLASLPVR